MILLIYTKDKGYNLKDLIKNILAEAINKTYLDNKYFDLIEVQAVTAKNIDADFFSNISMKLAKELKDNPMHIAEDIIKNIVKTKDFSISIVKPGYINFLIMDKKKNKTSLYPRKLTRYKPSRSAGRLTERRQFSSLISMKNGLRSKIEPIL